jgi:hypothetical protein
MEKVEIQKKERPQGGKAVTPRLGEAAVLPSNGEKTYSFTLNQSKFCTKI